MTATATSEVRAAGGTAAGPRSVRFAAAVRGLGSMKLAVWLVLILAALTWLGTLAQTNRSTFDVQREYFESWFVLARLELSFWGRPLFPGADGSGFELVVPLPGAYPVMALLFVNLLVGGLLRMRWSLRNLGILVTHVGIALLLVAGFVKLHYSWSGSLGLYETPRDGGSSPNRAYESSRFVSFHDFELALLADRGDTIEERVVPERQLHAARGDGSVRLRPDGLPFEVQVHRWHDFCRAVPKGLMVQSTSPVVDGAFLMPQSWSAGEQPRSEQEIAGCYVTVYGDDGERIEGILWGLPRLPHDRHRYPFTFTIRGQRYGLDLRHVVFDLPFGLRLDRFQKLDHPGTMSPKDFRSFVSVLEDGQAREAQIFMNNPLRKDGYVVYQTNWGPQPMGGPPWYSVFEVSYNPSDFWPTLACFVIFFGLLVHFVGKLVRFLDSSTRSSLAG
ncbi:MAG: cytochrome c biogenesis protein ResB [Planctomycetes bacterium]|nr:cytochrome c biogenesis protein ResB [Planctomycetota bacterium]